MDIDNLPNEGEPARLTERQERIARRLDLIGPGPGAFFRDACGLMAERPPKASVTHIVSHLLREIDSAMRKVLSSYGDENGSENEKGGGGDHKEGIEAILNGLGIPLDDPLAKAWMDCAGGGEFPLHSLAHRRNLSAPRPLDDGFQDFWDSMGLVLDKILDVFEGRYLEAQGIIDKLIEKKQPSQTDLAILQERVPNNPVSLRYFYSNLEHPSWLDPLDKAGLFHDPTHHGDNVGDRQAGFTPWPQGLYLERMAPIDPDRVTSVFSRLETGNPVVYQSCIKAACALPAGHAATLCPMISGWIQNSQSGFFIGDVEELCDHLLGEDELDACKTVLESQLAIVPPEASGEGVPVRHRGNTRIDDWHYSKLARNQGARLAHAMGEAGIEFVGSLLMDAIRARQPKPDAFEDHSHIWYPQIGNGGDERLNGPEKILIAVLLDVTNEFVRKNPDSLSDIVKYFDDQNKRSFYRLGLHVLEKNMAARGAEPLIVAALTSKGAFDDARYAFEYTSLLRAGFRVLPDEAKEDLLVWAGEGVSRNELRELLKRREKKEPEDDVVEQYARREEMNRLALFGDRLRGTWRDRYRELVEEFGEPKHPEFAVWSSGVRWGPTSPLTASDIAGMTARELVAYLEEWEPPEDPFGESPLGLGRAIEGVYANDPVSDSEDFDVLIKSPSPYHSFIIDGHAKAAKDGKEVEWEHLLSFCEQALRDAQGGDSGATDYGELYGDRPLGKSIVGLLQVGFDKGANEIDWKYRSRCWELIAVLKKDSDPSPKRESNSQMDSFDLAVNTVRGSAVEAIIRYALWVRRVLVQEAGESDVKDKGFSLMPEASAALDEVIEQETSPAVRSVLGVFYPHIHLLDERWAEGNSDAVFFDSEGNLEAEVWIGYVRFPRPYPVVFRTIERAYADALVAAIQKGGSDTAPVEADQNLVEHLAQLYWTGTIDLEDDLVQQLLQSDSSHLRRHLFWFIGTSLKRVEDGISKEVWQRLMNLWQVTLQKAKESSTPRQFEEELAAFGRWFVADCIDASWRLEQAAAVLELGIVIEPDILITGKLAELSEDHPEASLDVLDRLVGMSLRVVRHMAEEEIRAILTNAKSVDDPAVSEKVVEVIHRLGARSRIEFRDMLTD